MIELSDINDEILRLIEVDKVLSSTKTVFDAPVPGKNLTITLIAPSLPTETFSFDVYEGKHSSYIAATLYYDDSRKTSLQTRHQHIPLMRVDIGENLVHTNPDGSKIHGSHIHVRSLEFGDRIAYPLNEQNIMPSLKTDTEPMEAFEALRQFCHIDRNLKIIWNMGV